MQSNELMSAGMSTAEARGHAGPSVTPADAAEGGGGRLDSIGNKWNLRAEVVNHRCKARTCPTCGRKLGWETRQALLKPERMALFKRPALLTLTLDPKRFDSPEDGHDTVTAGGYIRRLLRLLNISVWVWVLEFQQNGWPHWHVLVDLSERGRLRPCDLRRAWKLWRDTWNLGGLDLQERKGFETVEHAVMYVTKYLVKPPRHGYPAWFLEGSGRRLIQGSGRVRRLRMAEDEEEEEVITSEVEEEDRRSARSLAERMAECGVMSHVILRKTDIESGEERVEHLGMLPVSVKGLFSTAKVKGLPAGIRLREEEVLYMGGRIRRVVLVGCNSRSSVDRLAEWLSAMKKLQESS